MAKVKIAYLTNKRRRAEFIVGQAPPGMEVTIMDITLSDEEKAHLCRDADAFMVQPAEVSLGLLKQCPKVKLIQVMSAGHDRLDVAAIGELGVPVADNGGANAIAVAEHTIGLMICVGKRLMLQWDTATNRRQWQGDLRRLDLSEVTGKTVGIVGLGRIGKEVAKRLCGFDCRILATDSVAIPAQVQRELGVTEVPLDDLLRESDIVTLHVPLMPSTRKLIGERELALMKPDAILINACRGPVVDEKALYRALVDGRIGAAGLDVLEKEPTPRDNPLFDLKNVVITPHMAGASKEREVRTAKFAFANIQRVVAGEAPESRVFPE